MISAATLYELAHSRPLKVIPVRGKPYLERFYMGTTLDGKDLWLHHFLTADAEEHLHSHGFNFRSIVLRGSYLEQVEQDGQIVEISRFPDESVKHWLEFFIVNPGRFLAESVSLAGHTVSVFDWHRIAEVEAGTWTLMIVEPERLPFWYFKDADGYLELRKSSPREWWLGDGVEPKLRGE